MTATLVSRKGKFGQDPLPWKPIAYMEEYLLDLEVQEMSAGYLRNVRGGLAHFALYCETEGIKHPDEIQRNHILRYQADLNAKPISVRYRQQLLTYLRGFINWCERTGYITTGTPWVNIKIGSVKKKPNPLEDEDLEALFAAHKAQAFVISPFMFHRREVILALLYGWGLRIHELQSLNVSNMDMRLDWVSVKNKGKRDSYKQLPYGDEIKQAVARWLRVRSSAARVGEDALLVDSEGKRLSIQMIRKIVYDLGDRAHVAVNPHRLRDTCGTALLDDDVPIERVMKILGHASVTQTRTYARVNDHKVKESHDAAMGPRLRGLLFQNTKDLK